MNNLPMVADNLSYRAMIYIALARYDEAIAAAQEAYQISLSIGNVWGTIVQSELDRRSVPRYRTRH